MAHALRNEEGQGNADPLYPISVCVAVTSPGSMFVLFFALLLRFAALGAVMLLVAKKQLWTSTGEEGGVARL